MGAEIVLKLYKVDLVFGLFNSVRLIVKKQISSFKYGWMRHE